MTGPSTPRVIPPSLAVPSGHVPVFELIGRGVQIYVCQPKADQAAIFEWAFRAPEADLLNGRGEVVGRHFAGPTWEANDGSRVVGEPRANATGADPAAIPWLLIQARSHQGSGLFSSVAYIHRLDTSGGRAPADGCDEAHLGQEVRVPYTATYAFYYVGAPATR